MVRAGDIADRLEPVRGERTDAVELLPEAFNRHASQDKPQDTNQHRLAMSRSQTQRTFDKLSLLR